MIKNKYFYIAICFLYSFLVFQATMRLSFWLLPNWVDIIVGFPLGFYLVYQGAIAISDYRRKIIDNEKQ